MSTGIEQKSVTARLVSPALACRFFGALHVLAYLLKMPANFVPHYLMIQASSELTRPGTCLVYSWKDLPAGFYRLNVTMTRDRNFSAEKVPFQLFCVRR